MDENKIRTVQKYLYEKYGNIFNMSPYARLWILYRELSIDLGVEYVSHPDYGVILEEALAVFNEKIIFISDSLKMIENNSLWNLCGIREESVFDSYYFGRLIMLIMGHYGLTTEQIESITHVIDPESCLLGWTMHCLYNGWCYTSR